MPVEDLIEGWRELTDACPAYEKAEGYYEGDIDEVFASPAARAAIAETGAGWRFNLAKTPVTVRVDRTQISAITVPGNDQASRVVEEVWDANDMAVHYPELFCTAYEYGDAYLMVWPVEDDDLGDEPVPGDEVEESPEGGAEVVESELVDRGMATVADRRLAAAGIELTVHNPKHVRVFYDPEHPRRPAYALKRWPVRTSDGTTWRADLYYPDRVERYVSDPKGDLARPDGWDRYLDDDQDPDDWELANPTGRVPFGHYRTAAPYGRPVHKDAYSPQDALNKLLITQLTTTDHHGFPQRYALTDLRAVLDHAGDGPEWDDDTYADDTQAGNPGGITTALRSGPGTLWDLVGKTAVGQFDAADPAVFLDPATFYIKLMAQATNTPLHYFDPAGDVPSGESLKVADMPLTKDLQRLTAMLNGPVVEDWTAVLALRGVPVDRVDVRWAPVESSTGRSDWETARLQQSAGVPRAQTLIERGYEAEQVAEWHDDEADQLDLVNRVQLAGLLADAVQRLGVGVQTGVVSEDTASRLLARVLGDEADLAVGGTGL